jgi:protein-S-isoprenylcysteine O-methyltransferase Ste14
MSGDAPFRVALVVIFVLSLGTSVRYRLQAAASDEPVSRRDEGLLFAAMLRLAGIALGLATLGYVLFPAALTWASLPLPAWLRWIGLPLGLASAVLMAWTLSHLGKNLTDTVFVRRDATLVTTGPYAWVRHPFYVTAALLMAAATLLAANWLIGLLSVIVLALLAIRTPKEEAMLMERFGDAYRAYAARTGRFWPRMLARK